MAIEVHYETGHFVGSSGALKLNELLVAYSGKGAWEVVSVVPITKEGETAGGQIVLRSTY